MPDSDGNCSDRSITISDPSYDSENFASSSEDETNRDKEEVTD